jgi:glycine/serine hydroxymethyltransferase
MGVSSVTTQGMGADEMVLIADFTARILRQRDEAGAVQLIALEVAELCAKFPPYPN